MPYLVVENGNRRGLNVPVPEGGKVTFGRDSHAEISVADHLCSRRHFEVESKNGTWYLRDLESSNGTYVNDQRTAEAELCHGDCIQAGETQLTFLVEAEKGARGLVGKTVGGYRILERIGRGGMGTVYKANQVSLNRVVALKILSHKVADDPSFVTKFHKEAQAAGRLNHPNIVQVYDVGSDAGLHYYSMEYIENGSVQDLATREGRLEPDLALAVIMDAARGLEYAEKKGLVHRDIKPDNLMINAEGVVKIADLGLARDAGRTARETEAHEGEHHEDDEGIFGTPHFISPEQAQGRPVDTRSDIYSLGATFYRIATGETPFGGNSVREIIQKQITEDPVPVREKAREVPGAIAQVIDRMMRKDPAQRYASAAKLLEDLERINRQLEGGNRKPLLIAAAVAVLAVTVGVIVFLPGTRDGEKQPTPPVVSPTRDENPPPNGDQSSDIIARIQALTPIEIADKILHEGGGELTEENLGTLRGRYADFANQYAGTPEAEKAQARATELDGKIAELRLAREAREEAARKKAEAARARAERALAAADQAMEKEQWGTGATALLEGLAAPELQGFPEPRAELEQRLQRLVAGAEDAARKERDAARALADGGNSEEAAAALEARSGNLLADLPSDPRLDAVRAAASGLEEEAATIREAAAARLAADRAYDQQVGFDARKRAFGLLSQHFDPEGAQRILAEAKDKARTEGMQALLQQDIERVSALERVRDRFLERIREAPPDPETDRVPLPRTNDPSLDLPWKLLAVEKDAFRVQSGPKTETHPFDRYSPPELYRRLFQVRLRPDPAADAARDDAVLFWLGGEPQAALKRLPETDTPAGLAQSIQDEVEARKLIAEIRRLEKKAAEDPLVYLNLLPLIERFLEHFRHTLTFLENSDGSTPVLEPPTHEP